MGYIIVAVVAVAVAIFAMQNTTPVTVRFIAWQIEEVPVAAVVLASLGAGIVIVGIPLWFRVWRLRSRLRAQPAAQPSAVDVPPDRPLPPDPPSPPYDRRSPPDRPSSPYDR